MKYSILVPVYNVEKYLPQCIESVLNQTLSDFELVLTNDGSTDDSPEICKQYAKKDLRIIYLSKTNEGLLLTRRFALKHARGEYVLFLDSDDYWDLNLLEEIDKAISESGADIVNYRYRRVRDDGTVVLEDIGVFPNKSLFTETDKDKYLRKFVSSSRLNVMWGKAVRRDIIDIEADYTGFKDKKGEDLLQTMELLKNARSIYYIDKPLYNYRLSPSGRGRNFKIKFLRDYEVVREYVLKKLHEMDASQETVHTFYIRYIEGILSFMNALAKSSKDYTEFKSYTDEILTFPTYVLSTSEVKLSELNANTRFSYFCISKKMEHLLFLKCRAYLMVKANAKRI